MSARIDIPQPVTLTIPAEIIDNRGHTTTVRTVWFYDIAQPHQLTLRIIAEAGALPRYTEWLFARSLLWSGLAFPTGDGDVQLQPVDSGTLAVALSSPSGSATLTFLLDALAAFAARIYALVPDGQEPPPDISEIENVLRAAADTADGDR